MSVRQYLFLSRSGCVCVFVSWRVASVFACINLEYILTYELAECVSSTHFLNISIITSDLITPSISPLPSCYGIIVALGIPVAHATINDRAYHHNRHHRHHSELSWSSQFYARACVCECVRWPRTFTVAMQLSV